MAQITVVYKDFEEMKAVARKLLQGELPAQMAGQAAVPAHSTPAPAAQPTAPVQPAAPITPAQPAATAPTAAVPPAGVPTSAPSYTRDDLSRAAMTLMDKGMQAQLQQLIQSFGVPSLVDLPAEQYGNFATALRGLGAQI